MIAIICLLTITACKDKKVGNEDITLTAAEAKDIFVESIEKLSESKNVKGEMSILGITYITARTEDALLFGSTYYEESGYKIDNESYLVRSDESYLVLAEFASTDPTSGKRYSQKYYEQLSAEEYRELSKENELISRTFPFDPKALSNSADARISGTHHADKENRYDLNLAGSVSISGETKQIGVSIVIENGKITSGKGKIDNEYFEITLTYDVKPQPHSIDYYKYNAPSDEYAAAMKAIERETAPDTYTESNSNLYPVATKAELAAIRDTITNNPYDIECTLFDGTSDAKSPNYAVLRECIYEEALDVASHDLVYDALRALEKKERMPAADAWYAYYRGYFVTIFTGNIDMGIPCIIDALIDPDTPTMQGYAPFSTAVVSNDIYPNDIFSAARFCSLEYEGTIYNILLLPMKSVIERAIDILDNVAEDITEHEGSRTEYGIDNITSTNEKLSFVLYLPEDVSLRRYMEVFDSSPFFSLDLSVLQSEGDVFLENAPTLKVAYTITLSYRSSEKTASPSENGSSALSDQELKLRTPMLEREAERLSKRNSTTPKIYSIYEDILDGLDYLGGIKSTDDDKLVFFDLMENVSITTSESIDYPSEDPLITLRTLQAEISFSSNTTLAHYHGAEYCHPSCFPTELGAALLYLRNLSAETHILINEYRYSLQGEQTSIVNIMLASKL